jgi:hypothetical protein
MIEKPFAAACECNQQAILKVLMTKIKSTDKYLLEIGSGTVYKLAHLSFLI